MVSGFILLLLCFWDYKNILSHLLTFIIGLLFSFGLLGYSFYLLKKRKEGKGIYWDDKGIVFDPNENKVYWYEIEDIKFYKGRGGKSTVIYTHYTNHEKIRLRHKKWLPTTAHSIDWFWIEKPRDMHTNLMKTWKERKYEKPKH
ncbi:hypothetical protein AM1BK_50510 [Neobacillus kokaensis]|uniref:Uncharacterized protein n=2 Tax=Neobacillus kokaensis TaxID=2759023 RepID=A0ABQ3NC75_9BACI|nr:hypothetical protein AM1BK_50510 [Neobacillus kokaensis]